MIPKQIEGATRQLGAPVDWDRGQPIYTLPIRDVEVDGRNYMISRYEPTPDELAILNAGGSVELWIAGVAHPVIRLGVAE